MQLPICVLIAWLAIILFALLPKRLTLHDYIFLYLVVLSFTSTSYTFFELNLHSVTVPRVTTALCSAAIFRLITVPLAILMAINELQGTVEKKPRWFLSIAFWLGLSLMDWCLHLYRVLKYEHSLHWHALGTPVTYLAFIVIPWGLTKWYKRYDTAKVRPI